MQRRRKAMEEERNESLLLRSKKSRKEGDSIDSPFSNVALSVMAKKQRQRRHFGQSKIEQSVEQQNAESAKLLRKSSNASIKARNPLHSIAAGGFGSAATRKPGKKQGGISLRSLRSMAANSRRSRMRMRTDADTATQEPEQAGEADAN